MAWTAYLKCISGINFIQKELAGQEAKTFDQISLEEATPCALPKMQTLRCGYEFLKTCKLVAEQATVYETLERPLPTIM
jgi:hypothetical protein